jgi:hypothetical protein
MTCLVAVILVGRRDGMCVDVYVLDGRMVVTGVKQNGPLGD